MSIQWDIIREEIERTRARSGYGPVMPAGEYVGRVTGQERVRDKWGRDGTRVTLKVAEGPHTGTSLSVSVHGHAESLLKSATETGQALAFAVYQHRLDDGRAFARVNVETIRLVSSGQRAEPTVAEPLPTAEDIQLAIADFTVGFVCRGRIETTRQLIDWYEQAAEMAARVADEEYGQSVFASAYVFTTALRDHVIENDRKAVAAGSDKRGSMAGFNGPAYAPLITVDIDRYCPQGGPDVETAKRDTIRLVEVLVGLGVSEDLILVFFSGSKGFHVQFPSSLAGAEPSERFADVVGAFCEGIAATAGVTIDPSLYRTLQPLRSPNSRNEKSGLFKVWLSLDELKSLPMSEIEALAHSPRPFTLPSLALEPLPQLAESWRRADQQVQAAEAEKVMPRQGEDNARLFRSTWDFLVNGAPEGSRATELYKAAANLLDFESVEDLVRALLQRPVDLSGLSPREADGHIDGAVRSVYGIR